MLLFNRYEYNPQTDLIGKGGFSKVYKAFDKKFHRWVALKIFKTNDLAERYSPMAEVQRVIDLDHPNICRYIDFEEVEKEDTLGEKEKIQVGVMEFLDGGNFLKYYSIAKDLVIFKKLLIDVLRGLAYLHKKGIIHRDIKPANILIKTTESGPIAKITDFGISKKSDSSNSATSSALIVSIPYMAPEQLNVQKYGIDEKVSFNIDFWSLGVAVFEVITGELLFKNSDQDTSEQIMMNILSSDAPEKIKLLPEPFRKFVSACLQKDAKQRVKLADDLLTILSSGDDEPVPEQIPETRQTVDTGSIDETRPLYRPDDTDVTRILPLNPKTNNDETRVLPKPNEELAHSVVSNPEEQEKKEKKDFSHGALSQDETLFLTKQRDGMVTLFSRYEYFPEKDLIGKGGFSRVYRAYDKKLSRWVALKIYKTEQLTDRYSPIAEIKRVITFDHSNICRYLDIEEIEKKNLFGEIEVVQVCVMELLDGGNLLEYYTRNKNIDIFKKLLNDVFSGLSYLHKNGIIHRDIKPANILIKETIDGPVAKITDFGISKKSDSINSESSSALIVSIPYMAPEQLNVKKYGQDDKIRYNLDLWTLGVTIYEVLSGNLLFKNSENESSEQIMANIMAPEIPAKLNQLPQPYRDIVAHCVVKNARDRAQKVEELMVLLNSSRISTDTPEPQQITQVESAITNPPVQAEPIAIEAEAPEIHHNTTVLESDKKKHPISLFLDDEPPVFTRKETRKIHKPSVSQERKVIFSFPVLVFSVVVIGFILLFILFKHTKPQTVTAIQPRNNTTAVKTTVPNDSVKKKAESNITEQPKSLDSAEKKVNSEISAPSPHQATRNTDVKKAARPISVPVVTKNLSQELMVRFTPVEKCTLQIKNITAGYIYDNEELLPNKTIRVYLKPGEYSIIATSSNDNSKTKSYHFNVKAGDINTVSSYVISF
jgi:serine/threonine protein kinase